MKSLFVGLILLFSSMTFAQDLNFSQYRKFLMNGNKTANNKIAIQTTCTTTTGQTYRIGDSGYDTCFAALKNKHDAQTSTPTTIHIGN